MTVEDRFWAKVRKGDGCWEWTASRSGKAGYGKMSIDGRLVQAHRIAWSLAFGPIPDGLCVLHRCDNRACVRSDHLFLGTKKENTDDMWSKGRGSRAGAGAATVRGEKHGRARLTAADVVEIRRLHVEGLSLSQLCAKFGAKSTGSMSAVVRGKKWRHV